MVLQTEVAQVLHDVIMAGGFAKQNVNNVIALFDEFNITLE